MLYDSYVDLYFQFNTETIIFKYIYFSYIKVLGKNHTIKLHTWGADVEPPTLVVGDTSGNVVYPD